MLRQDRTVQAPNPLLSAVLGSPPASLVPCCWLSCKRVAVENRLLKCTGSDCL